MRIFDFLHKYFGFNKRERNGIVILIGITISLLIAKLLLNKDSQPLAINIQKLNAIEKIEEKRINNPTEDKLNINLKPDSVNSGSTFFSFDPNTIDKEGLQKLGLKPKLISTLINFRTKGGKFKSKEDLKKIYGLNEQLYFKLEPYIIIPSETKSVTEGVKPTINTNKNFILDINNADSSQIIKLPGIGAAFTRKILKFRNALGGFTNIQQLKEVYGMKDSTFLLIKDKILINAISVKKININTAPIETLKRHPYISFNVASTIVNFRSKHGLFKSPEQLLELGSINEENYNKLLPYLEL